MALLRGRQIEQLEYADIGMAGALYNQFNEYHTKTFYPPTVEIETEFYEGMLDSIQNPTPKPDVPKDLCIFTPSGADKCSRELYYKHMGVKAPYSDNIPYHKRWTRNATLVHEGIQKDLLYMEKKMPNAPFVIQRMDDGTPAWEDNIKTTVVREFDGVQYGLTGMMDGKLLYKPTDTIVGFEFKTKSNTIAQVGTYKMKAPSTPHLTQCIAYSLLFGITDYILMYEALAKDGWMKGVDARVDIRTFHHEVTQAEQEALEKKFADVVKAVKSRQLPDKEPDKCLFCNYRDTCNDERGV